MIRWAVFAAVGLLTTPAFAQTAAERLNDYPTVARADYVFGCMAANGQRRDILIKCACSIDHIATILPYERYTEAETVLSMQQVGGERMSFFRTSAMAKGIVSELRRAQAEAEILCFQE
ncbi:MAG: hypothetical protein AAFW87_02910 [Pseudomonadota bacterium]